MRKSLIYRYDTRKKKTTSSLSVILPCFLAIIQSLEFIRPLNPIFTRLFRSLARSIDRRKSSVLTAVGDSRLYLYKICSRFLMIIRQTYGGIVKSVAYFFFFRTSYARRSQIVGKYFSEKFVCVSGNMIFVLRYVEE